MIRALLAFAIVPLALRSSQSPATQLRALHGTIVDANTLRPLSSATVVVMGRRAGSVSGNTGAYTIDDVPRDSVHLQFRHPCYFTVLVVVPPGDATEVSIGLPFDRDSLRRPGCGGLGRTGKSDEAR